MPIYSYQCKSCGHAFDELQKIADRKVPEGNPCPECGEEKVEQTLTPVIFNADALPKHSNDFKYLMNSIKKANHGSNMPDY